MIKLCIRHVHTYTHHHEFKKGWVYMVIQSYQLRRRGLNYLLIDTQLEPIHSSYANKKYILKVEINKNEAVKFIYIYIHKYFLI